MDYEKKYNEALERAREIKSKILSSHLSTESCKAVSEYIDTIIPELRESEDERIRKWIYNMVENLGYPADEAAEKELEEMQPLALAYLDKQKESLHISEMCKENADSFTDDIIEVRSFQRGIEEGRRLEKQKEQPTNEEMLRTLRTEYEKGVADTIAKYEQKEQKEIPLMNGDADLYFDNWIQHNDTTKRGCFQEGIRYAQRLQKEQKLNLTAKWNGVYKICPHCKSRMIRDDSKVYTSMPPQYGYNCPKCGTMEFDTVMYDNPEMEEQKSAEYGDEFIAEAEEYASKVNCGEYKVEVTEAYIAGALRANNKPAEWSEEDERMRNQLIYDVEYHKKEGLISAKQNKATEALYNGIEKCYDEKIAWLKSLRPPQYCENCRLKKSVQGWKPSKEQMDALKEALETYKGFEEYDAMKSLYNELKKLK